MSAPGSRLLRNRKFRSRLTASNLLLAAGALVLLTPLALWGYQQWREQALYGAVDLNPAIIMASPPQSAGLPPPEAGASGPPADAAPTPPAPLQAPTPADPADPSFGPAGYRIEIPKLGTVHGVQLGIDNHDLDRGPGHYPNTPHPGQGNAAIAGHRTYKGKASFFFALNRLQEGDRIHIVYPDKVLQFSVQRVFITSPYDLSVLKPTEQPFLTLTTCDPPGTDTNRLIVQAKLVQ